MTSLPSSPLPSSMTFVALGERGVPIFIFILLNFPGCLSDFSELL
jgi:hypothetical protein